MKLVSAFDSLQTALVKQIYIEKKKIYFVEDFYISKLDFFGLWKKTPIFWSSLEHCTGVA